MAREERQLSLLLERYPALAVCAADIDAAFARLRACYQAGGKLLIAGNGGSAADAEHMVGELMKGFRRERRVGGAYAAALRQADGTRGAFLAERLQEALPAIALDGHPALSTAFANDRDPVLCFAQQVSGYGRPGDVFLGISTSGTSENILYAAVAARARGMGVIGLTGAAPGHLAALCDVCIRVPETETYRIQEYHLPVYHTLCLMLEESFFPLDGDA